MPIHNFVDNILNTATLHVRSAANPATKKFISHSSFLICKKEHFIPSFFANFEKLYLSSSKYLNVSFNLPNTILSTRLPLSFAALYVKPYPSQQLLQKTYVSQRAFLLTPYLVPASLLTHGTSKTYHIDETNLFVKEGQDQDLTWSTATNLIKSEKLENNNANSNNDNQQQATTLKEFWA
jgi:hypothetical protein